MEVLVGIPTHKRPEGLLACLKSIEAQEGELPPIRVFVADNDPVGKQGVRLVDELASGFRFPISAMVVEEPGISAVRNAILERANQSRANFVAMIDDDVRADGVWLSTLVSCAEGTGADIVAGPVDYEFVGNPSRSRIRAFWTDTRPTGSGEVLDGTTAVLIRCEALQVQTWPQFDLAFGLTGGGDKEWFVRLQKLGFIFSWDSRARVVETVPPDRWTRSWIIRRRFRIGIDDVRIATLHKSTTFKSLLICKAVCTIALSPFSSIYLISPGTRYLIVGKWARASGRIAAVFGIIHREYAQRHERLSRSKPRFS